MAGTSNPPDSVLAIAVGAVNTRAILFDVVDGRYRFVAAGAAPSTADAPFRDIGEGVHNAMDQLQAITNRKLIDDTGRLIIPSQEDGNGVDACVATLSAGTPLRVVAVGLLDEISADSALQLASTTYARVLEKLSINDRRKASVRLDAILRARPDVVILAGGTEGGASGSVLTMLESIGLACYLIPKDHRPEVLYVGNQSLNEEVKNNLASLVNLSVAPNIRPAVDIEQLGPAHKQLGQIYRYVFSRKLVGVKELDDWAGGKLLPVSTAFGRVVRFLSEVYDPAKGALGIDVGASATILSAAFDGELVQGVYSDLGLGKNAPELVNASRVEELSRWLPVKFSEADLRDYVYNKALHPGSLPITADELAIEQALARRAMQIAVRRLLGRFPKTAAGPGGNLLPWLEPVVAAGSVLSHAPTLGQSMLTLLDGLQPVGVTTVVLDQNNLSASLGVAGEAAPVLPVQLLESGAFLNLAPVIAPAGVGQLGSPALRIKVTYPDERENTIEVKHGALEIIQAPAGQAVKLSILPLNHFNVGVGAAGRWGNVRVYAGALGIVIDARGRPLRLPAEDEQRRDLMKKWSLALNS